MPFTNKRPSDRTMGVTRRPRRRFSTNSSSVPEAIKNLPLDPPSVRSNMRRQIVLQGVQNADANTLSLSWTHLTTLIANQLFAGVTTVSATYQVIKIAAWGVAGPSGGLSVTDNFYNITSTDLGSYSQRPKVGLFFPSTTRALFQKSTGTTAGNLCTFKTAGATDSVAYQITVDIWPDSAPDITEDSATLIQF